MCWFCSDLKVKVAGENLNAHKFVLAARSDVWSLANMASTSELDLSGEQPWCDCHCVTRVAQRAIHTKNNDY